MIDIRFISSVELQKVMADLGERLTEEEVQTNKKINTKRKKNENIRREIKHKYMKSLALIQTRIMYSGPVQPILKVEEMMRWADKDGDGKVFLICEKYQPHEYLPEICPFCFQFRCLQIGLKEFSSMMSSSAKETRQK